MGEDGESKRTAKLLMAKSINICYVWTYQYYHASISLSFKGLMKKIKLSKVGVKEVRPKKKKIPVDL